MVPLEQRVAAVVFTRFDAIVARVGVVKQINTFKPRIFLQIKYIFYYILG